MAKWKGYRIISLSSSSLEDSSNLCMVRVMFKRWLLWQTLPSSSAEEKILGIHVHKMDGLLTKPTSTSFYPPPKYLWPQLVLFLDYKQATGVILSHPDWIGCHTVNRLRNTVSTMHWVQFTLMVMNKVFLCPASFISECNLVSRHAHAELWSFYHVSWMLLY